MILLPDADISEPGTDSDSETDRVPAIKQTDSFSESEDDEDDMPLADLQTLKVAR